MADIAAVLGVSKNAVSLALRGKEGVSEELRQRVLETAQAMQYTGHMQPAGKGCILALIPRYLSTMESSTFYMQVCFHMEAYARSKGYQLIISSVPEGEEEALTPPPLLESISCCGVMTIGNLSLAYCRMISRLGLPFLMVDQSYDELICNSVTSTNATGAYLLTRHLIENGHVSIEYLGKRHTTASLNERWEGYCRAMNECGLPIRRNLYVQSRMIGQIGDGELMRAAFEAMTSLPTALVCGHDNTALDAIRVLGRMGIRYPEDISAVGFDDIQQPEVLALRLTTYQTHKADIASSAIDLFIEAADKPSRRVLVFGDIIYRDSVRDIRHT